MSHSSGGMLLSIPRTAYQPMAPWKRDTEHIQSYLRTPRTTQQNKDLSPPPPHTHTHTHTITQPHAPAGTSRRNNVVSLTLTHLAYRANGNKL